MLIIQNVVKDTSVSTYICINSIICSEYISFKNGKKKQFHIPAKFCLILFAENCLKWPPARYLH